MSSVSYNMSNAVEEFEPVSTTIFLFSALRTPSMDCVEATGRELWDGVG